MQTIPLSAKTIAPASRRRSPESISVVTAAVKPTPLEPRPVVAMARGALCNTYLKQTLVTVKQVIILKISYGLDKL